MNPNPKLNLYLSRSRYQQQIRTKPEEPVDDNSPEHSHPGRSRESSPLPVPMPLPVLHPSIFSEEGLLAYAIDSIHPPQDASPPVEQVRPDSQMSSSNHTVKAQDHTPDPAVQYNTYADFYAKDPRRRKTPLLHVKPLPNNQPLPKPEREYDSYADFYANDPRRTTHVDDRPLPALMKKKKEAGKSADRSSLPQSSSKPSKILIPSKAPADPPRLTESKRHRRPDSRPAAIAKPRPPRTLPSRLIYLVHPAGSLHPAHPSCYRASNLPLEVTVTAATTNLVATTSRALTLQGLPRPRLHRHLADTGIRASAVTHHRYPYRRRLLLC
ncbi:hypothetical protein BGW80DRAFT_131911 [Lactifluus volemus]|nr:hypothetical protein BGW80DRAFT_131911 [Lactifluus volemus]